MDFIIVSCSEIMSLLSSLFTQQMKMSNNFINVYLAIIKTSLVKMNM